MTDTRIRVPLDGKEIRLDQLAGEVGVDLSASASEVVAAAGSTITVESLAAAVAAHVPQPTVQRTVEDRLDDAMAGLQQIIDGPATMNATQLTAAVKAQARVLRGLIRHARNIYDAAD